MTGIVAREPASNGDSGLLPWRRWRRTLVLLWLYMHRQILGVLSWRGFMLTLMLQQTVTPLLGLAVWSAVLPGNRVILAYFVALMAVQMITVCYEHETFLHGITGGGLAGDLLRPHPVVLQVIGDNLAWRIWHVGLGAPVVVVAAVIAGVTFEPAAVLLSLPAVLLAALLRFLFSYVLVLTALWTQQARNVVNFGFTLIFLLGGAAAPIPLFPESFRAVGEALPFRAMHGFPAEIASGSLSAEPIITGYAWQVWWTVLFTFVAIRTWRSGVRRYVAVGA